MRHFPPPISAAVVAGTVVAGLACYQGVDKLVLARGGSQHGTTSESGHEPSSTTSTVHIPTTEHTATTEPHTSTTEHHEPNPTTSTTSHTSTTEHHEPKPTTSTTVHKEPPRPSTTTTVHHEPTPPPTNPPTTVAQLSLGCMSGFTGGQGASK